MKVLVTGGTGVIGNGLIPELIRRGHAVRLLSRHADEDAKQWIGVEPFTGDVSDAATLFGAATGCDAIVHIAGIVTENPPAVTFEKVNVAGTRNILEEATRAGVNRFVQMSSLGADRGESDYHKSKSASERLVEQSALDWTIVRPGNVYGPGDEVISLLLKMVRILPVVPVIDRGDQPFQPLWFEDLARAVAALLEGGQYSRQAVELAGSDVTSSNDVIDRLRRITDRNPVKLPIPSALASVTSKLAASVADVPIDDNKLTMLKEENVVQQQRGVLRQLLGTDPTPLDEGLRKLADALPEQLPEDGVGAMHHKRFWADIAGSTKSAAQLMATFRADVNEIMPIEFAAEPGAETSADHGKTLTGAIPLRGNIQVRVELAEPTHVVFATVEGHPLAGTVEFTTEAISGGVRFAIDIFTRAANIFDLVALRTVGAPMQDANWRAVVQRMIDESGGTADGVQSESRKLGDDEAEAAERRIRQLVQARKRSETLSGGAEASQR